MARDLGTKYVCFKCGTKFYDLKKPAPTCPKCGADQREAPSPKSTSARARAVFSVVVPAALPGIITGIILALARVAGETAPLLFTAFNNRYFSTSLTQPISTLTVQVFTYATGPYQDWHRQAWAGALVLVTIVLVCSLVARVATRRLERMHARG